MGRLGAVGLLGLVLAIYPSSAQTIDSERPPQVTPGGPDEATVSLFGIRIGTSLNVTREHHVFVEEGKSTLRYLLRNSTNREYLLQAVEISKLSHVVVSVEGRTASGSTDVCQRRLSETVTQLETRYPKLRDRVDDVAKTTWHLLSMDRPGCFLNVGLDRMSSLRVPCSSSFLLHCERLSNAFIIKASDTEFSNLARDEAETIARTPKRNHLD